MPAQVQAAVDRLTGAVKQFTVAQRTLSIIGVAVLVLGAFALSSWLSRPTLSPLFTGLSGADASAVVDQLTAEGVQYQLADGGSTVLVPEASLYDQRIKLAAAGLPTNADGGGYSLLDEMPMTSSEFQQQTTYQRALEGELARTIGAIDGVESATVKLALPEESVFVSEKADPTASVFVRTRPGTTLSVDQVQAIVHLVSAGIDGMKPTDVAVVDASGEVLSAVGTGTTGGSGKQASDYEARVAASVQALLDRVVGPGRSAVTVTAEVDQSQTDTTTEKFTATPDTPPLASSTTTETYEGGSASGAAGVLGPDNIAVPGGDGAEGSGTYESTTEDRTNAVDKTTERVQQGPGAIERQSVAVVLDEKAAAPIDLADLRETIAAAAGVDAERGDTIAVQAVPFDTTQAQAADEALAAADAAAQAAQQRSFIQQAAIGGVVLALLLALAIGMTRRSRKSRRTAIDLGELQPVLSDDARLALEGLPEDALPELPSGPLPTEPDPVARKRAEITALADEQPQEVADLLRGWLGTATPAGRR